MISGNGMASRSLSIPSPPPARSPPPRASPDPPAGSAVSAAARGPPDAADEVAQFRHGQPGVGRQDDAVSGPADGQAAAAADLDVLGPQVDQHRGVLVHAEHRGVGRKLALHDGQPPLAEVACLVSYRPPSALS